MGIGTHKDPRVALDWFRKAAEHGDKRAKDRLRRVDSSSVGNPFGNFNRGGTTPSGGGSGVNGLTSGGRGEERVSDYGKSGKGKLSKFGGGGAGGKNRFSAMGESLPSLTPPPLSSNGVGVGGGGGQLPLRPQQSQLQRQQESQLYHPPSNSPLPPPPTNPASSTYYPQEQPPYSFPRSNDSMTRMEEDPYAQFDRAPLDDSEESGRDSYGRPEPVQRVVNEGREREREREREGNGGRVVLRRGDNGGSAGTGTTGGKKEEGCVVC